MKTITVIQARVGSSRLPGKVMRTVLGKPVLYRMIERVRRAQLAGTVVVATTTQPEDDAIAQMCQWEGIQYIRGSELDVLDRHYQAARLFKADIIAKIPSDCPLIDPEVIDLVFHTLHESKADYVSNLHPASYPDGNDVEVMTMQTLTTAWQAATKPFEREHTTPFIWERPKLFDIENVTWDSGLDYSMSHRWTLDYQEDFDFIKTVYEHLYLDKPDFGLLDILRLVDGNAEIREINQHYAGVNWYRNHLDELKTITAEQTAAV